jgi:hypothetical protein
MHDDVDFDFFVLMMPTTVVAVVVLGTTLLWLLMGVVAGCIGCVTLLSSNLMNVDCFIQILRASGISYKYCCDGHQSHWNDFHYLVVNYYSSTILQSTTYSTTVLLFGI